MTDSELKGRVEALLSGRRPLEVVQAGDPVLRVPAQRYDDQLGDDLLQALLDAMRAHLPNVGVGIAAPQIGIPLAIAVIEDPAEVAPDIAVARERGPQPLLELVNPKVTPLGDELVAHYEGCLSVEGWSAVVARHRVVRLDRLDRHGEASTAKLSGWSARIVQHETDHLNGILYIDRAETRSLSTVENHARLWSYATPREAAEQLGFELPA
ncbi:MAG: hypothetical protein JWR83_2831 [Aeromicrobium sp.]|nr:hypothetical protein [Aeromicrobium sp.]